MKVLNLGIVGFGRIGREHAGWISTCQSIRVAAVADVTPARRELARQAGFAIDDDPHSLFGDASIDAVLIATPTVSHFELAMAALRAGKHVMVEKPMAMNFSQANELVETAKVAGHVLSVFHNRRWDADFLTVDAAIKSGIFGKLINIESRLGQWASCVGPAAPEFHPNWRNEAAFGGGGLLDWGSHFLDQLWQLFLPARPVRVFSQLRGNVWSDDCDDFARVCIDFDNDAVALLEINTTTNRPLPRWHIDGTAGSADSPHSPNFDVNRWAELDFFPAVGKSIRIKLPEPGLNESQIWDRFAQAVAGDGSPAVTPESVLLTMSLLDAARQSSQRGKSIDL
jgi:scyllo-inositol 2-dehydrogenase (NADP+)